MVFEVSTQRNYWAHVHYNEGHVNQCIVVANLCFFGRFLDRNWALCHRNKGCLLALSTQAMLSKTDQFIAGFGLFM